MRTLVLALLAAAAVPATAAEPAPASGFAATAALGGGSELGSSAATGLAELELGAGWELGTARPEATLLLGLAPGTYLGLRPGVHVPLPFGPLYARGALDIAHAGGTWRMRWLLAGGGAELRLTSVLSAFGEADLGIPLDSSAGVPLLVRAGFAFRF